MAGSVGSIKPGLERTKKLLSFVGNPEKDFHSIQITGTNGKGSTAIFLHNILVAAGVRTGLYTSPHFLEPEERVRVMGENFPGSLMSEVKSLERSFLKRFPRERTDKPTFFELSTAVCLSYFRDENVDCAVLETGLGGRLDSVTAAMSPIVVCTSVSLDHREYLGGTIEEIFLEKIYPFRNGVLILGEVPSRHRHLAEMRGKCIGGRVYSLGREIVWEMNGNGSFNYLFRRRFRNLSVSVEGRFQRHNATLALAAAEVSYDFFPLERKVLRRKTVGEALRKTKIPGRMEKVGMFPTVYLDVGHNPDASKTVRREIDRGKAGNNVLVFTLMRNRSLEDFLKPYLSWAERIVYFSGGETFHDPDSVREVARSMGARIAVERDFERAYGVALDSAGVTGMVLLTGSYHIAQEYYRFEGKKPDI